MSLFSKSKDTEEKDDDSSATQHEHSPKKSSFTSKMLSAFGAKKTMRVRRPARLIQKDDRVQFDPDQYKGMPDFDNPNFKFIKTDTILDNFGYVSVILNNETNEYVYHVVEPRLTGNEENILKFIKVSLDKEMGYKESILKSRDQKEKFVMDVMEHIIDDHDIRLSPRSKEKIYYYIIRDHIGYSLVELLMKDSFIEDISCDGPEIPIFIYHREFGSIKTNLQFDNDVQLEGFVVELAQRCGRTITVADPVLDATLPDGSRLNATYGREITTRGSSFTIRRFKEDPLTMPDLVKFNSISSEMAAHLWLGVQYGESIIFAGGSASGKTTTLNAVSLFIPPSSKVISIEDTREINLPHENWIAGLTRGGAEEDTSKSGTIDMYALLKAALRQRPEYVLVGEVRGKETMTMFQAMATGHTTYSTMHAESVQSIVYRLENPPISIPRILLQALNLVVIHGQYNIHGKKVRRITELVEIIGLEPTTNEVITNKVFTWAAAGDEFKYGGHSRLYEKIMDREDMTMDEVLQERGRRAEIVEWMVKENIRTYTEVSTIVSEYYTDPDQLMLNVRRDPSAAE